MITPFAVGFVSFSGTTTSMTNGRGPADLTATRTAKGFVRISWTNAYTTTYIVNATACPSTNAHYSCMVQKSSIANTNFSTAIRDSSNVAADIEFMFVMF